MTRPGWRNGLVLLTLLIALQLGVFGVDLRIQHRARSLQPGEVVLISSQSPIVLKSLRGELLERNFAFHPRGDGSEWEGLVGIDLDTSPGEYQLTLKGVTASGGSVEASYPLRVQGKEFPTRRLTVDEKFVNPPQEALPRIRRESKRTKEIFAATTPQRIWQDSFRSPVPGAATSGFGKRSILNGQPRSPHAGTDFDAEAGTPVWSPSAGKVVLVSDLFYSGNTVILDHGQGLYSYFAHLSGFSVAEGEIVKAGQTVGQVGATGRVTGAHLHWSVRLSGTRVDPLSLMAVLSDQQLD